MKLFASVCNTSIKTPLHKTIVASGSDKRGFVGLELRITVGNVLSGAGAKHLQHDGGKGGVYGMYMDSRISSVLANEIDLLLVVAFC